MGALVAKLKTVDYHDLCSYTTPRVVRIKDWRLGTIYYSLMSAIFVYVILWSIVMEQRYRLKAVDIVGSTRLQLRAPDAAYSLLPNKTAYCDKDTGFPAVPVAPCRYLDSYDSVDPGLEQGALFASTRITEEDQTISPLCLGQPLPDCEYVTQSLQTYYVGEPEWSTLLIDHSFSSASLKITKSATDMHGKIVDLNGNALDPCDDYAAMDWLCNRNVVKVGQVASGNNSGFDIVPLATLLRAAGIGSLDQQAGSLPESYRHAGMVLVVTVQYSNYYFDTRGFSQYGEGFSENFFVYSYTVQAISNAEFKYEQVIPEPGSGALNRTILDRHGMRILFKQSGNVGAFDAPTLLIALTSSLGLLAVASLVVDFLATSVLPLRRLYGSYKKMDSVDTAGITLTPDLLALLNKEDLVNPRPAFARLMGLSPEALGSVNLERHRDGEEDVELGAQQPLLAAAASPAAGNAAGAPAYQAPGTSR